ncbi:MAG: hypothetical protein ACOZDY_08745 [Pseudomonadota bacterium]
MQGIRNMVHPTPGTIRLELTPDEACAVLAGLGWVQRHGRFPGRPWRRLAAAVTARVLDAPHR